MRQELFNEQNPVTVGMMTDEEIIRRVAEGEKELYSLIIRRYNQRLYRIGLSIINSESAIEDVMQTTYIKAYENLDKFQFHSSFSTWIIKILINECLQYLKKREQTFARERANISRAPFSTAIDHQTPLMKVINSELKNILELSIRRLPEKYRTVFVMRELENISIAEAMECLGLTSSNIKVRLNRAKVMLRDQLRDYIKEDDLLQFFKPRCDRIVGLVMDKIDEVNNKDFGNDQSR